ncbi:hypothetical protein GCM10027321_28280 [Massilia terrae]|uniref:Multiubiquitin domain-containing protein n=1 Tax=Massilia terrae TaxID=1811224 RepID=A0ABT2D0K4_9BURK|nr:multiubiquitin domain-containing protein [Massilia terrae]MCS0659774.1 multiubiquitin domain-containing protein [Massilia terrae]
MNHSNYIDIQVKRNPSNPDNVLVIANGNTTTLHDVTPTGRQVLMGANCHPPLDFQLLQWKSDGQLEEIGPDELMTLDEAETHCFALETDRLFYFVLNDMKYPWAGDVPEAILRRLAKAHQQDQVWQERRGEADMLVPVGQAVSLVADGVERFYTKAQTWKLDVQNVEITSTTPTITVRHALELAKINPDLPWIFILKVEGKSKEQVELDTVIDLRTPGIERLRVRPKVINNGEGPGQRRQFTLLPKDEQFLATLPYRWETVLDQARRWLLLHDFEVPAGYQLASVTLAIEIPALYPSAELDMFYCSPALALASGTAIPQTEVREVILGESFQRWSRHRDNSVWSPADDSVITHLALVEESMLREVAA